DQAPAAHREQGSGGRAGGLDGRHRDHVPGHGRPAGVRRGGHGPHPLLAAVPLPAASMAATATMYQVMADPRESAAATSARMPAYPVQATVLLAATATTTTANGAPASSRANVPTRSPASVT